MSDDSADLHEMLISTDELAGRLGEPGLVVLDCTVNLRPDPQRGFVAESMGDRWEQGHIPGSRYCDLTNELSDPNASLRFMAPSPERFAAAMRALGVDDDSEVVLYDARFTMWATRVFWMLKAYGFDNARVLDGGWKSWSSEERPVETGPAEPCPPGGFVAVHRPELFADADQVMAAIDETDTCIINALSPENHDGTDTSYGRAGHIPGASNVFAMSLVDPATHRYRPLSELAVEFETAGARTDGRVITYCGGGIAATSDAFVLTMLGHDNVAVYDASLSEWCADPARPLEV